MVALVKPLDPLHAITFTQDRALIRQVIAAFEGHAGDYTPRTEFERNFMSRDPKTAEATRAQVVSAALQSLARAPRRAAAGRKALIFVSEGFRPAQPRAIIYAANRNGVAIYSVDPHPEAERRRIDAAMRSPSKPAARRASTTPTWRRRSRRPIADLDHYFVLSFPPSGPADGQISSGAGAREADRRAGAIALGLLGARREGRRSGGESRRRADGRCPSAPSRSSPYIRPWIGMSRGPDGLTSVTVTWESGATPPRNQRVASILVKATANDGTVLFENRVGAGDVDRATFNAPPGYRRARDGDSEQQRRGARYRLSRHFGAEPAGRPGRRSPRRS